MLLLLLALATCLLVLLGSGRSAVPVFACAGGPPVNPIRGGGSDGVVSLVSIGLDCATVVGDGPYHYQQVRRLPPLPLLPPGMALLGDGAWELTHTVTGGGQTPRMPAAADTSHVERLNLRALSQ